MHTRNFWSRFALRAAPVLAAALLLGGCLGRTGPQPVGTSAGDATVDPLAYTQAAATLIAEMTRIVPPTGEAQALPTETPTEEPLPPTSTPLPTNTPLPSDTPLPTNTPLPSSTSTPVATATATTPPEPGWQLDFYDDFTTSRFWVEDRGARFNLNYTAGGYTIINQAQDDIVFSTRSDVYEAVRVEASATWQSGAFDAYYGVICNFTNGGNYYLLGIGGGGWYGIVKKQSGRIYFLTESIDTSGTVRLNGVANAIRGDCNNGRLVLWVNGVKLAETRDLTFPSGTIGIGAGTRREGGIQVHFDDFYLFTLAPPGASTVTATP